MKPVKLEPRDLELLEFVSLTQDEYAEWEAQFSRNSVRLYRRKVFEFLRTLQGCGMAFLPRLMNGELFAPPYLITSPHPDERVTYFARKSFLLYVAELRGIATAEDIEYRHTYASVPKLEQFLQPSQVEQLLQAALEISDACYLSIILSYFVGLSTSDMLRLKRSDIYKYNNIPYLKLSDNDKSGERALELSLDVFTIICAYCRRNYISPDGWLFPSLKHPSKPSSPQAICYNMVKASTASGIPATPSSLRTSYIATAALSRRGIGRLADYVNVTGLYVGTIGRIHNGLELTQPEGEYVRMTEEMDINGQIG